MTIEEWAKDFKSYVNALDMQRDDYKSIMEYIDDALALLKEQELIRCKDCVHYCYYGLTADTVSECVIGHCENPDKEWFCADGERKEGR